ncbi:hypothetical protein LSH36_330g03013 [Paralvinella palmiformis]|uniref:MAM domain-containing protein n=1 Tax=Paralvinella palmiformis TaxID=53620 RepID=A0AAD9JHP8_9ANNE|nr:hypothetical protein LSH36_330g03013 [Paralvinella palmiformis]
MDPSSSASGMSLFTFKRAVPIEQTDNCHGVPCYPGQFTCFNRKCIPISLTCDATDDCGDGSDESYMHARCEGRDLLSIDLLSCDFELDICGFLGLSSWKPDSGYALGPAEDHTLGINGHYLRTQFTDQMPGTRINFFSQTLESFPARSLCLSFWYYSVDDNRGETNASGGGDELLSVRFGPTVIWRTNSPTNAWHSANVVVIRDDNVHRNQAMHTLLRTRPITERSDCPWYTDKLHEAKRLRRKLERRWKKIYRDQCIVANKFLKQTRIAYYSEKIIACAHDKVAKQLLGDRGSTSVPQTRYPSELTEMFSSFFINKIQNIRRDLLTDQTHSIDQDIDTSSVNTPLERFTHA